MIRLSLAFNHKNLNLDQKNLLAFSFYFHELVEKFF